MALGMPKTPTVRPPDHLSLDLKFVDNLDDPVIVGRGATITMAGELPGAFKLSKNIGSSWYPSKVGAFFIVRGPAGPSSTLIENVFRLRVDYERSGVIGENLDHVTIKFVENVYTGGETKIYEDYPHATNINLAMYCEVFFDFHSNLYKLWIKYGYVRGGQYGYGMDTELGEYTATSQDDVNTPFPLDTLSISGGNLDLIPVVFNNTALYNYEFFVIYYDRWW